jgi:hypothetical protein
MYRNPALPTIFCILPCVMGNKAVFETQRRKSYNLYTYPGEWSGRPDTCFIFLRENMIGSSAEFNSAVVDFCDIAILSITAIIKSCHISKNEHYYSNFKIFTT